MPCCSGGTERTRRYPPGGMGGPGGPREGPRSVIRAAWPDSQPTWPAFQEGKAVLRITDADLKQLAVPGLAQRPHALAPPWAKPATATAPDPKQEAAQVTAQTTGAREWGADSAAGPPPPWRSRAPQPTPPPRYSATEGRAPPPLGGRAVTASTRGGPLPCSPLTADR